MIDPLVAVQLSFAVIPAGIGLSIVIATWYYNRNYYLRTKIEYIKIKNENKRLKNER